MPSVRKWGKSLVVRIPAPLADQLHFQQGTPVEITTQHGSLVVTPRKRPRYSLREMLKRTKTKHLHELIDFGPDVGREVID